MKVSDYIISFLFNQGITDVFGYPGGMVTHLMDSFSKYRNRIAAHVNYHEQGAAFAACGYAQITSKPGVAYATSGPGATNLITGICNAYFDSIPTLFITGQVNTYEGKGDMLVRQKGFQEMDVVSIVSGITKYCAYIGDAKDIRYNLEKAFYYATEGRPGPAVLDIPMDIQRTDIEPHYLREFIPDIPNRFHVKKNVAREIYSKLLKAKRPCILAGAGIQNSGSGDFFKKWVNKIKIPVVSSMLAVDVLPESNYYFGFIGAYGIRYANFILAKSDLIIALGSRMDLRQTGTNTDTFAINAHLLRIDIDEKELSRKIKDNEESFCIDLKELFPLLLEINMINTFAFDSWLNICNEIKSKLAAFDEQPINTIIHALSKLITRDAVITTDVGQNQVWVAQSFITRGQRILFSGGHGAMGYSLPAAIGAHYGCGKKVYAFMGDGGLQMNIQEIQFIAREKLPVKIILLNNSSLGMIRHFQEMYFESNYVQTKQESGYTTPNFGAIAGAYGIPYCRINNISELSNVQSYLDGMNPAFIEIVLDDNTYVSPKLAMGKLNQDQEPSLDRDLYNYIESL